ncbi:hypothetical protein BU17DRAFT_63430 [Hysterangium stoloniferum]|nr:hypothetical protein BU17DRAFT_63430 [Hysterangium stoloniferum]
MEDSAAAQQFKKFKSKSHQATEVRQDMLVSEQSLYSEPSTFSAAMSFESEELNPFASESPVSEPDHPNSAEHPISLGPYIRVVHHPHSGLPDKLIYCDSTILTPSIGEVSPHAGLSAEFTKRLLKGVTETWVHSGHGKVTFSNLADYRTGLEAARNWIPEFKKASVSEIYDGKEYTFNFYYCDPWQWVLSLVTDATLAKHLIWYPVKKYLHDGDTVTQLYDDIDSGKSWWDIQNKLPSNLDLPHCFLPLHIWLDKGKVSTTTKLHPALLRAGFLPGNIQNGSGNGGAVLFLIMPVRVLTTGIIIQSVDGEEAASTCATRGASALHPCPRCLVHKDELTKLTKVFPLRTIQTMLDVILEARTARSKKKTEEILQDNGLHIVDNAFWTIANSDPYSAVSYDTLHSDDLGKWGDHLFPKMVEVLCNMKQGGKFSEFMSQVPSWPGLKIVQNVITVDFSDGNTYWDILKTTLPCIVQLFPPKSSFIHCVRALAIFRMFAGLHMITTLQLNRMQVALAEYETYCEAASKEYGKDFHFPKQHAPAHLYYDITHKGSTINYTTWTGEGFQQESRNAYFQTNYKDVERQIVTIDANKEALAYIAMDVEIYDNELKELKALYDDNHEEDNTNMELTALTDNNHWKLGAPQHYIMTSKLFTEFPNDPFLHTLTASISNVVRQYFPPSEVISTGYRIIPHKCVYIHYTSLEDWKVERDIACCNPSFHGHPQYDCVIINTSRQTVDMAVVQWLNKARWKPKTPWKNCQVFEEKGRSIIFLKLCDLVAGCITLGKELACVPSTAGLTLGCTRHDQAA